MEQWSDSGKIAGVEMEHDWRCQNPMLHIDTGIAEQHQNETGKDLTMAGQICSHADYSINYLIIHVIYYEIY